MIPELRIPVNITIGKVTLSEILLSEPTVGELSQAMKQAGVATDAAIRRGTILIALVANRNSVAANNTPVTEQMMSMLPMSAFNQAMEFLTPFLENSPRTGQE